MKSLPIIDIGLSHKSNIETSVRVRIVNALVLFGILTLIPEAFLYRWAGIRVWPISMYFVVALAFTWVFNWRRRYTSAKVWLFCITFPYIFWMATLLGRQAGEQLMLIPIILGAVLVFNYREKILLGLVVLLNLFTFVALEITDYSLWTQYIHTDSLLEIYHYNMILSILTALAIGMAYYYLFESRIRETRKLMAEAKETEGTIFYFANSLFGQNTVDDVLWDVAKNCIGRLGFVDCVIYLLDESGNKLVQKAAYGPKNPKRFEILQPLTLELGQGVVGHTALTGRPILINDAGKEPRYVQDLTPGLSELAVPMIFQNRVIGVIDSEHSEKHFFTHRHAQVLQIISALCASKVARIWAENETKKTQSLRREAERIKAFDDLKSKLFTNISHEIRTPLTLIKGTISKHLKDTTNPDWELIDTQTDRLLRLSNQLLDLTRLESGEYRLSAKPGELSSFLELITKQFTKEADEKDVVLSVDITPVPAPAVFDRDALEKILYNLLSNAIKYTKRNSTVRFFAEYDDVLHLRVIDQGPGIPEAVHHKVFDRFFRVDPQNEEGHGIGLALVNELVKLHHGNINVENTQEGGACFTVELPLKPIPQEHFAKPNPGSSVKTREQYTREDRDRPLVLVVEDHREIREFIGNTLSEICRISQAANGKEALDQISSQVPDMVVSDVMMPVMNGLRLCETIHADPLTSHIPILLLTAKADSKSVVEGLRFGADDYLTKPFNPDELKLRVKNRLAQIARLHTKYAKFSMLPLKRMNPTDGQEKFLHKVLQIVDARMGDPDFSVAVLCEEVGASRMQLHRKLKALTGESAQVFVNKRRMHRASRMLTEGSSASETAYEVGYNSLSHFSKTFKKSFGVSPSKYASKSDIEN